MLLSASVHSHHHGLAMLVTQILVMTLGRRYLACRLVLHGHWIGHYSMVAWHSHVEGHLGLLVAGESLAIQFHGEVVGNLICRVLLNELDQILIDLDLAGLL